MRIQLIKIGLWFHTAIMTLAGLGLFLFPKTFGPVWPWAMPPALGAWFFLGRALRRRNRVLGVGAKAP
jgi:hypothetical protein